MVRVLVVDDEHSLTDLLKMALRYEGWEVRTAGDGHSAVKIAREFRPDAIVLDIMLPDIDGLEVLQRVRADGTETPVLFLTAKDSLDDRIAGLTAGGDDYVTKPFSLEEVVARLRGLIRRSTLTLAQAKDPVLAVGDLTLDEDSYEVARAGTPIELTATEFELLRFLMRNPRRVLSQGADPRPGLELRLRRQGVRRRALHLLPAQEDRRRPRADDPHRARRRLHAQGRRMTRPATRRPAATARRPWARAPLPVTAGGRPGAAMTEPPSRRRCCPRCGCRRCALDDGPPLRRRRMPRARAAPVTLRRRLLAHRRRAPRRGERRRSASSAWPCSTRRSVERLDASLRATAVAGHIAQRPRRASRPTRGRPVLEFLRCRASRPARSAGSSPRVARSPAGYISEDGRVLDLAADDRATSARRRCPPTASRTPSPPAASATTARSPCADAAGGAHRARPAARRGRGARRRQLALTIAIVAASGSCSPSPSARSSCGARSVRSPGHRHRAGASPSCPLDRGDVALAERVPRRRRAHRGRPARHGVQPHARPRGIRSVGPRAERAARCAASSPTRATSCAPRSPRSAATPSSRACTAASCRPTSCTRSAASSPSRCG